MNVGGLNVGGKRGLSPNVANVTRCIFGSHNAPNTADAVVRTSEIAIGKLMGFLKP